MMFERLLPIQNVVANRLLGRRTPELAAEHVEVVQPAETEFCAQPALFLTGQLERAVAGLPGQSHLEEIEHFLKTDVTHAPLIRYSFRNCLVHEAGFDTAGYSYRIKRGPRMRTVLQPGRSLPKAVYCMTWVSHQYFGHWLQDACATAALQAPDEALLLDMRSDWPHTRAYVEAFGLTPEPAGTTFVESLTFYQDHGQGSLKLQRYARMREQLARKFATDAAGPEAVYFRRGATGMARLLANEDAVAETLSQRGFEIVDLAGASPADLYNRFKHTRIVVSMDGSHLNHLYFSMPAGAALVTLIPADRFTLNQVGYAHAAKLHYGFLVVTPTSEGYVADIADLLRTIDLVTAVH